VTQRGLARVLGLGDLSILASASMAPAYSIATTFGVMIAAAGAGAPLALLLLAVPVAFIALSFHRLCAVRPDAGSTYAWSRIVFGRTAGAFSAWIVVLSYFFGAVAAVVPAGTYTLELLSDPHVHLIPASLVVQPAAVAVAGGLWVIGASVLLIGGVKPTANASGLFLWLEIAALLLFVGLAFAHPVAQHAAIRTSLFTLGPLGMAGFAGAMVSAIWVIDGWEVSSCTSEEGKGTSKDPGKGGIIGLVLTTSLTLLCMVAFMRIGPLSAFANHADDTLAYVAAQLGGGYFTDVMVAIVLLSTGATLWTTQLGLSRIAFSMARDRLFPRVLTDVHPQFGTPHVSIAVINVGVLVVTLLTGFAPNVYAQWTYVLDTETFVLGLTFIITGLACATHFLREGTPPTDLTRVVLPLIGVAAIVGLLVINFASLAPNVQWLAIGALVVGLFYAAAMRRRLVPVEQRPAA
jgi:amino acid transporter